MNEAFNTKFYHIALAFLLLISGHLSAQLQADITGQKSVLDDQVLELKKEISGGGTIDLLDATTERIDGICSFDKNKLATGRAFIFDEISISYKSHATDSGKEGSLQYNAAAPAELQNAIFILNQDGREVLRMPFRELNNIFTSTHESTEYKKLKSLRFLGDDRTITAQLKFPPGVALSGTVKHYIYLRISGLQTSKKANV